MAQRERRYRASVRAPSLTVTKGAADALRRGHPWVWRDAVTRTEGELDAGSVAHVVAPDRALVGSAIVDPGSPIVARLWALGDRPLDDALVAERVARALALRATLFADGATTAYRLLHGEGDRMPGIVADRYGEVAVLRLDGAGSEAFATRMLPLLLTRLRDAGVRRVVQREARREDDRESARASRLVVLDGDRRTPVTNVDVREHGVPFTVDLAHGQKTGAFLDQRENRRRVGELTKPGARVLNLFSYAGGFSQRAARSGGTVTSVDIAGRAHATAQASFKLAGIDPRAHEFVTADAFAFLAEAKRKGRAWDLVVSDPPSFAPSERALSRALAAYRSLHRACADVLAPGGLFCAASCSSHVDALDFASTLDDAALGRSDLRVLESHGAPVDHPTLAGWPEGRYLKFLVLA